MHKFSELVYISTISSLVGIEKTQKKVEQKLKTSSATRLVKALQSIRMQKIILAVGMFSIFEAWLQGHLNCDNGFVKAKEILTQSGDTELLEKFIDLELATNVLKHGSGRSYNKLLGKDGGTLKAHIREPGKDFYNEDDVSEIRSLINVDDGFITHCVRVIDLVSEVVYSRSH